MSFPSVDQLNTLADAREAYANILCAYGSTVEELETVRGDMTAASEMLDEANGRITALTNDLNASLEKEQQLVNELAQAKERLKEANTRIKQLKADAKSAEAKAAEICASVGVDPFQVTPGGDAKQEDLLAQFNAISDPAKKTAFFRAHRAELIGK